MTEHKSIAAALVAAQGEAGSVAKNGSNEYHKYRYATSEDVIEEGCRALVSAGLAASLVRSELVMVAVGEGIGHLSLRCAFVLRHAASGEKEESESFLPLMVDAKRAIDKAVFGARTESLAYYLRDLLLLKRGEDTVSGRNDDEAAPVRAHMSVEELVALAAKDIAAAATLPALRAVAKKLAVTPEINGAYREALLGEYKAREAALRGPT